MEDCLFCKIVEGKIPSDKVFEDDEVLAFRDINPQAPVHVLIIPKRHISGADKLERSDDALLGKMIAVANRLAVELGISESGYRLISNIGDDAGQSVHHLHLHLIGGKQLKWDN